MHTELCTPIKLFKKLILFFTLFCIINSLSLAYCAPAAYTQKEIKAYIKTLKKKNLNDQVSTLYKLLDAKDKDVFPILQKILDPDKEKDLYTTVVDIMGSLNDKRAIPLFFNIVDKNTNLNYIDYNISYSLGRMAKNKQEIFNILLNSSGNPNEKIRVNVIFALGETENKKAIPALIRNSKSKSETIRIASVDALGRFKDKQVTQILIDTLKDQSYRLRDSALNALAKIKDPKALPYIISVLQKDTSSSVKITALNALGYYKREAVEDAVISALKDPELVSTAAYNLERLKSKKAIPALLDALNTTDISSSAALTDLLNALGTLRAKEGIPQYARYLTPETDTFVRKSAIYALGMCKAKDYMPDLVIALRDPDYYIREAAIKALAATGDNRAVPFLVKAYSKEKERNLKNLMVQNLSLFSDKTLDSFFIRILDRKDKDIESYNINDAVTGLGKAGGENAIKYLARLYKKTADGKDNTIYESFVIKALGDAGGVNPLLDILSQSSSYTFEAEEALIKAANNKPDLIPVIITRFDSTQDRRSLIYLMEILSRLGAKDALPSLEKYKNSNETELKKAGIKACDLIITIDEGRDYINSMGEAYKKGTELILKSKAGDEALNEAESILKNEAATTQDSTAFERLGYLYYTQDEPLKAFANFKKSFETNTENLALDLIGKWDETNLNNICLIMTMAMVESVKENPDTFTYLKNMFNCSSQIKRELAYGALYQLSKTKEKAREIIEEKILKDNPKTKELKDGNKIFSMVYRVSTWEVGFTQLLPYAKFTLATPYGKIHGFTNSRGFFSCPNVPMAIDEDYSGYIVRDVESQPSEFYDDKTEQMWAILKKIKKEDNESFNARADEYFVKRADEKALVLYGHQAKFNTNDSLALIKSGILYYDKGNKNKASEYWDQTIKRGQNYSAYIIPELAAYRRSYPLLFEQMQKKVLESPAIILEFLSDRAEQTYDYLQVITAAAILKQINTRPELMDTLESMFVSGNKSTYETAFLALWKLSYTNENARKILEFKFKLSEYNVRLAPYTPFILKTEWGRLHARTDAKGNFLCKNLPPGNKQLYIDNSDKEVIKILESVKF